MEKETKKAIAELIVFTAVVFLVVINIKSILSVIGNGISIIMPFLIGGIIAFVLNIPMSGIEKALLAKTKGRVKKASRSLSIFITFVLVVLLGILIFFSIIPQISGAIKEQNLAIRIPEFLTNQIDNLKNWVRQYPLLLEKVEELQDVKVDWNEVLATITGFLGNGVGSTVVVNTFNLAGSILGGIVNALVAVIFSIYLLAAKENLARQSKKLLTAFVPEKTRNWILKIVILLKESFRKFITGQVLEACILGFLFFVVLSIGRFPYALLISVVIGVMALVPIVGAFVGCFVGAFLILLESPMKALWFVVVFLILQQIEGNLIYPRVVGNSVGLPAMWVLAAVTIGGSLFGVGGMLCFIPLVSALYSLLREITNIRLQKKKDGI